MRAALLTLLFCISLGDAVTQEKPAGKLTGLMFGDYFYNAARDSGISSLRDVATGGMKSLQGFEFRRIYFTYDHVIARQFSGRFRIEANSGTSANGSMNVIVKDAYLKWTGLYGSGDLVVGVQPTSAFQVSERIWGYRSLEKTIMDLRKIVPSRDFGVSLRGSVDNNRTLGYWVMVANGRSTGGELDRHLRVSAHLEIRPIERVTASLYGDFENRDRIADPYVPGNSVVNGIATAAAFLGYTQKGAASVGVEAILQSRQHGFNTGSALAAKTSMGVSVFGSVFLRDDLVFIARYDRYDPTTHAGATGDVRDHILVAVDWKLDPNVSLMPNLQYEAYEKISGRSVDPSVTARVTFSYLFL